MLTEYKELLPFLTPHERAKLDCLLAGVSVWEPTPGPQQQAFESLADITFFGGAAGGGKRLDISTPVPTPSGWTTMGDLKRGDKLFRRDGKTCTVCIAHEIVKPKKSYEIKFDDGSKIVADADHLWLTFDAKELAALTRRDPKWREERRHKRPSRVSGRKSNCFTRRLQIWNTQHPPKTLSAPVGSIRTTKCIADTVCTKQGRHNHAIPVASFINLPFVSLPINPYVLGVWLGDGNSSGQGLTCADLEIIKNIKNFGYKVTKWKEKYAYGIHGITKHLKSLSILGSGNKKIPSIYLRSSKEQRLELLQGLMDTDGHANKSGSCEFDNTNLKLISTVLELILSLGYKATLTKGVARLYGRVIGPKYRIKWCASDPVFKLKRKAKRQGYIHRRTTDFRYIVECKPIQSPFMRCITVDSEDGLYLVGKTFIPTHNTDVLLGLALKNHHRSIIFRRVYPSLQAIIDRARKIYNPDVESAMRDSYNESLHRWKFHDGKQILFGSLQYEKDVLNYQGQPFDFYGFDELTEFSEAQFRFVTGWNRTTRPGQRCRIVGTGNPPTTSEGEWVIKYWGPWLDPDHPNPAESGELRWYTTIDGVDFEVPDGDPVQLENGEIVTPRSRTFIPAKVQDNPYLMASGYVATLQALPEPLRSKLLFGDFRAGREDNPYQVIPSEWVKAAQLRWVQGSKPDLPMSSLGVDVARGGKDKTVLTPRYGNFIDTQIVQAGSSTPDGPAVATLAIQHRRDNAKVNVDIIGVGTSPYDHLKAAIGSAAIPMNGAEASDKKDKSKQLGFVNKRAEWYWNVRELLDPTSGQNIMLPPDPELRSDLCSATWKLTPRGIQIESKDDIIKRLGRSPDKGDSCVYALAIKQTPLAYEGYIGSKKSPMLQVKHKGLI